MKRFIAIGLMALTMFSISAFANGPLLGVSFVPTVNSMFNLSAGWDFGQVNIEASKTNLATLGGDLDVLNFVDSSTRYFRVSSWGRRYPQIQHRRNSSVQGSWVRRRGV